MLGQCGVSRVLGLHRLQVCGKPLGGRGGRCSSVFCGDALRGRTCVLDQVR